MNECIFKTRRERTRIQDDFKCQLRANTFQPINFNVGEQKTQSLCADPWSTCREMGAGLTENLKG